MTWFLVALLAAGVAIWSGANSLIAGRWAGLPWLIVCIASVLVSFSCFMESGVL